MEKPFTLKINEFREKLCKIVNESGLPAYAILNEINEFAIAVRESDLQEVNKYANSLKGSEKKCKK